MAGKSTSGTDGGEGLGGQSDAVRAERNVRNTRDVEALKVFTHPLRLRVLRLLRSEGPATASGLARVLGATPSLISYHLRAMAKHGFIGEDPEASADGRERRWIAHNDLRFSTADFSGDEVAVEIADAVVLTAHADVTDLFEKSLRHVKTMGLDWQNASFSAAPALRLSAAELQSLYDELFAVVDRYRGRTGDADADGGPRERVQLELLGFPYTP
ncbi:helix-turn-helix domain-containing protein [Yinghuangia sp. YIM S09857]|uniref:helix-turn-helix domain-containing protein n=1 Tax=Yinghuangia sp. YIM S09857 TaxID=3436929 RepID=UPI003F53B435